MITTLEIQGLRGLSRGKLEGLAPLTILVGPNGCGKSTLLEAVGVACGGPSARAAFAALACREWLGIEGMRYWFDAKKGASVIAGLDRFGGEDRPYFSSSKLTRPANYLRIDWNLSELVEGDPEVQDGVGQIAIDEDGSITSDTGAAPFLPFTLQTGFVDRPAGALRRFSAVRSSSALRDALAAIKLSPWYDDFLGYLRVLRPDLQSIESIAVGDRDEPFMFQNHPRRGYPVAYAGDGFRRALLLAAALAEVKGAGVAAMDEPEAFAHPALFAALTQLIRHAVADGTQVFFSTHSLEFIAAVLREFEAEPDKVAVVGLSLHEGVLDPVVISGLDAYQRVVELSHDLRL